MIERNRDMIDINSLEGRDCYGGFDLTNTEDHTAAVLEFELGRWAHICAASYMGAGTKSTAGQ